MKDTPKYKYDRRKYTKSIAKANRKYRTKLLAKALVIYSSKCQDCNNEDYRVLQFHHVNGNKQKENKISVLRRIVNANIIIEDIRLLCANCHIIADLNDGTSQRGSVHIRLLGEYMRDSNA
jgi:hypothetical protein